MTDLFRELADDVKHLVRQEMNLARSEIRETGKVVGKDATKVGIAIGLAMVGILALGAFLVVALGDLLNNYWLSALIVGVVMLGIGAILGKQAIDHLKRSTLKPERTIETLRADQEWARREATDFKREFRA